MILFCEIIGGLAVILQIHFYGKHSELGPLFGMAATLIWMGIALHYGSIGLFFLNVILFALSAKNQRKFQQQPLIQENYNG